MLKTLQQPSAHLKFEMMLEELEISSARKVTIATTKSKPVQPLSALTSALILIVWRKMHAHFPGTGAT